jgi:hypothetical protein
MKPSPSYFILATWDTWTALNLADTNINRQSFAEMVSIVKPKLSYWPPFNDKIRVLVYRQLFLPEMVYKQALLLPSCGEQRVPAFDVSC